MNILIANDDGISVPGIYALAREISKQHNVIVVAPDDQRSAMSHAITVNRPLTVEERTLEGLNVKAYSVNGTPADCVRLALDSLLQVHVDVVISGINSGYNIGTDIIYSGTVSAAVEAAINKVPSIAVSTEPSQKLEDYVTAAIYAGKVLDIAVKGGLKEDVVLNLNVPCTDIHKVKGIKVCRMGNMVYGNYFVERETKEKGRIFDIMGNIFDPEGDDTDTFFISQGYATVTPLHYDLTNFKLLKEVEKLF